MDILKKKPQVAENESPVAIPTPVTGKMNGVLALLREKIMREYGLSAEEYSKLTITIKKGVLTIK